MNINDIEDKAKLIDSYEEDSNQNNENTGYRFSSIKDNTIVLIEDKKCKNVFKNIPLVIYVTILSFLLLITGVIIYLIILSKYEITYIYEENAYEKPKYSKYKYSSILFENGLKIVLVQVDPDDKAGAAISFDYGQLDNQFKPGYLELAFHSLINKEISGSETLVNYFGDFDCEVDKYYSSFYFQILGGGFQSYLKTFSQLTYLKDNDERFNNIDKNDYKFTDNSDEIQFQNKNHLLEYLIYGYENSEWEDIIPMNYGDIIGDLNGDYTSIKNIMEIILSDPTKIKIVIYSHYKMSLMKKYFLNYFKNLRNKPKISNNINPNNAYNISEFNSEKIIYYKLYNGEKNFIEIDYFLNNDKIPYNQLIKDSQYLFYITYILNRKDEGSLYYELNNAYNNISIKSLLCDHEVILKSKIKFSIEIELNHYSYYYITDIISRVYNYMNNIMLYINSFDNNTILNDIRIEELQIISEQTFTFREDNNEKSFYKNLATNLFYKDEKNYLLRQLWFTKQDFIENINTAKYYFNQFTINNSVILLGISDYALDKYNLYETNISYIFYYLYETKYFSLLFSYDDIDEYFSISYDNNYTMLINPEKNEFISKFDYNSELEYNPKDYDNYFTNTFKEINNASDNYLKVFWEKDTSFHVPKVNIYIAFFHPFRRPNFKEELNTNDGVNKNDILFFEYFLYIAYLKRIITEKLADNFRAHENYFYIDFNEDFDELQLLVFSDKVKKVLNIIKDIITNQTNFISSLEKKFEIYRDIVMEEFLLFGNYAYNFRSSYTFYETLTKDKKNILPPIYNIPKFPLDYFFEIGLEELDIDEIIVDTYAIKYIYLFGYYNENDALEIYQLFKLNNSYKNLDLPFIFANYNNTGIDITNYVDWHLAKPSITNTINITYNGEGTYTTRFMKFAKYNSTIECLTSMLIDILQNDENFNKYINSIIRYERTYIYLGYIFTNETMENDLFLKYIIDCLKANDEMYKTVDVIGDKFYYFLKGYKKQESTVHKNIAQSGGIKAYDNIYKNFKDNNLLDFNMSSYDIFIQEMEKFIYPGIPYIGIVPKE